MFSLYEYEMEVLFIPFTYFYIQKIQEEKDKYDEVWLIEIPTPVSFQKDIILWVDDQPTSNLKFIDEINLETNKKYEILQLTSTKATDCWLKNFDWILLCKNIELKIITDMVRYENDKNGKEKQNFYAGLDLL